MVGKSLLISIETLWRQEDDSGKVTGVAFIEMIIQNLSEEDLETIYNCGFSQILTENDEIRKKLITILKMKDSKIKNFFTNDEKWLSIFEAEVKKIAKSKFDFASDLTTLIILYASGKDSETQLKLFGLLSLVEASKHSNSFDDRFSDPEILLPLNREDLKLEDFSFPLLVKKAFILGQECLDDEQYQARVMDVWDELINKSYPSSKAPSPSPSNPALETSTKENQNNADPSPNSSSKPGDNNTDSVPDAGPNSTSDPFSP